MLKDFKSVLEGIRSVRPGGPKGAATTEGCAMEGLYSAGVFTLANFPRIGGVLLGRAAQSSMRQL
jgi:hypothetical protein